MSAHFDNPWNNLSDRFNVHCREGDIPAAAADNILIAWPALFRGIEKVQPNGNGLRALDFGCGAGLLAQKLRLLGYASVGCDTSDKMIDVAQTNLPQIPFYMAGVQEVAGLGEAPFALIVSVMVFQFIPDIDACFAALDKAIAPNGVLAFAVFNPDYVCANCGEGMPFRKLTKPCEGADYLLTLGGPSVPVYLRVQEEYARLFEANGYRSVHVEYPPFTPEFQAKFPDIVDRTHSEYLVMVWQKE